MTIEVGDVLVDHAGRRREVHSVSRSQSRYMRRPRTVITCDGAYFTSDGRNLHITLFSTDGHTKKWTLEKKNGNQDTGPRVPEADRDVG